MTKDWPLLTEAEALSCAGDRPQVLPAEGVTYVVGSAATLVIVHGGGPRHSIVRNFDTLVLREPFPAPAELGLESKLPVLGFAQIANSYVPLGRLGRTVSQHRPAEANDGPRSRDIALRWSRFDLEDRLPFDLLDQIRPTPQEPLPDLHWMDSLPHDPVTALQRFVADWYADVPPATCTTHPPDRPLPGPLLDFYRAAAGRQDVLGRFNRILRPHELEDEPDGMIVFATENQGAFVALIDPTEPDPTVHYDGLDAEQEREPLSGFLLQFLLTEVAYSSPFTGYATVTPQQAQHLIAPLEPVPLRAMRWTADPTRHYVAPGLVVSTIPLPDGAVEVCAGTRRRCALKPLREPGFAWENFDG
ncbi:hypothetical protein ACFFWC_23280 [Plantactinospora siamensis]|uniref:Uncharacterized protein n=1 Tax=Plantactinospora siamensis TaxID=555372 RepID=A0ABV6NVC5_9ACTN